MTRLWSGDMIIASTVALEPPAVGDHGSSVVLVAANAAAPARVWPPAEGKLPPAYTVSGVATMARTWPPMFGVQLVSEPSEVLNDAMWPRLAPSTVLKSPPT